MSADNMSAVLDEMRCIVLEAAAPVTAGESVKAVLLRAHRRLGISYRRVRGIYYGDARAIRAEEADALRARHRELLREELRRSDERAALIRHRLGLHGNTLEDDGDAGA